MASSNAVAQRLFKGVEGAKASFASNYLKPGAYYLRIDRVKADSTRKNEDFLAVEMTVLNVLDEAEGKANKVGENVSHLMMAKHDSFLGNVKAFVSNVLGCPPDEVTQENCIQICEYEENGKPVPSPLAGMVIEVSARNTVTKKQGTFTVVNYKREVAPAEYIPTLSEKAKKLFAPGRLDALAATVAKTTN